MLPKINQLALFALLLFLTITSCKKDKIESKTTVPSLIADEPITEVLSYGNGCDAYLRTYNGVVLTHFNVTDDGGYLFCGKGFGLDGSSHSYVLKTDCFGKKEWGNRFKETYNSEATHIIPLTGEDYIFYSTRNTEGNSSKYTSHITHSNKAGETIWTKKYDVSTNIDFRNVMQLKNNNALMALVSDYSASSNIESIVKRDFSGNELFRKPLKGGDRYHYLTELNDGSFLAAGQDNMKPIVLKLNAQGDSIWTKTFPIEGESSGFYITTVANGDIIMSGINRNSIVTLERTVFVARMNSNGNLLWLQLFEDDQFLNFKDAAISTDGNLLTNVSRIDTSNNLTELLKVNLNNGEIIWKRQVGEILATRIIATSDNALIYLGNDLLKKQTVIRKTDANGF